uniref:Uncharacterized protein n=1 Tax=Glossina palpalis gambiensis TaxID=67801 RepID=A0A1B0BLA9_9MUSC
MTRRSQNKNWQPDNDFEDSLNQYFRGSRCDDSTTSPPPRDYKIVQPKPVLIRLAITPLRGINIIITAKPANTEGPSSSQRKYKAKAICNGADHSIFK